MINVVRMASHEIPSFVYAIASFSSISTSDLLCRTFRVSHVFS